MTVNELALLIEIEYWADEQQRVAVGAPPAEAERVAANAHLPALAKQTARAAARWARRAGRPARYARYAPANAAATVARETEHAMQQDVRCGVLIETIGLLLLRSLLQNLAWRFAAWLLSDSTSEDRPDLICRMEAE
jgi:hypothetical protein